MRPPRYLQQPDDLLSRFSSAMRRLVHARRKELRVRLSDLNLSTRRRFDDSWEPNHPMWPAERRAASTVKWEQ